MIKFVKSPTHPFGSEYFVYYMHTNIFQHTERLSAIVKILEAGNYHAYKLKYESAVYPGHTGYAEGALVVVTEKELTMLMLSCGACDIEDNEMVFDVEQISNGMYEYIGKPSNRDTKYIMERIGNN